MSALRLLFALGVGLMVTGWLMDRIASFPWLLRCIAPADVAARDALDLVTSPRDGGSRARRLHGSLPYPLVTPRDDASRAHLSQGRSHLSYEGVLQPTHPGFAPLVALWPDCSDPQRIKGIGRRELGLRIGGTSVQEDFELLGYAETGGFCARNWSSLDARALVQARIDGSVFDLSRAVFILGAVVTAITGWPR